MLEESNTTRLEHLVPIRFGRMSLSAFAFYRGTADIMAFYARQLRDMKFSAEVEGMDPVLFTAYVELCATALA